MRGPPVPRTEKTRNVFRWRARSRLRGKEPGHTDPRGPRSASPKARSPRDPDFCELHMGPGVGPGGRGLRGRDRAAGVLHAVGQSDGAGTRGRARGPRGGARALATGSGMGAIASAILTSVDRGDHVVAGSSLYTATTEIFTRLLPRFGLETTFV